MDRPACVTQAHHKSRTGAPRGLGLLKSSGVVVEVVVQVSEVCEPGAKVESSEPGEVEL